MALNNACYYPLVVKYRLIVHDSAALILISLLIQIVNVIFDLRTSVYCLDYAFMILYKGYITCDMGRSLYNFELSESMPEKSILWVNVK